MPTESGRKAARMAVQREIAREGSDGVALGRRAGVHAQTVQTFLNGQRWPALKTLGKLDTALGWPVGTLSAIAEGGYPEGVTLDPEPGNVSAPPDTDDSLLFLRPPGVTDQEWVRIKDEAQGYIEWQIQKARREHG